MTSQAEYAGSIPVIGSTFPAAMRYPSGGAFTEEVAAVRAQLSRKVGKVE
jgi:hypothetical protein